MSKNEYTFVEVPSGHFHRVRKYERWLKENIGYASLSTWYTMDNLGFGLYDKLGFHHQSSAIVFFREEDATYFKLACPVDSQDAIVNSLDDGVIVYRTVRLATKANFKG